MATVRVSKIDFEAFAEMVDGKVWGPSYNDCRIGIDFFLPQSGVKATLKGISLEITGSETFYGRNNGHWNAVRFSDWAWDNFSLFGKGARATTTLVEAQELFETLI